MMDDNASGNPELTAVFERAFAPLATAVSDKRIPGGVLGIVDLKEGRMTRAIGSAQAIPVQRPMTVDTWFDLASLTKVIFTTTRILKLADDGTIDLDALLTTLLPDLRQYNADAWERKVTFRQCLGHQTPFPGVEPIYTYGRDPDLLRAFILQREWKAGPPVYSDINFILLGFALERLAKKTIREIDPGPGFAWSADPENAAATEDCAWRHRVLSGEVHDENCAALQGSGHAGLFGTVTSVLDFAEGILDGTGASKEAVRLMLTPLSNRRTHGWEHPFEGWWGGTTCSPATIGHTGFTGVSLMIDFDKGRAVTLLTNRVHPTRHFDSGILALRQAVGNLVYQS
ncbi:beta-lactamase family protein [Neorhizobium galegae]|uniref:serine hydrolase domain-containing protein n=1 Tax=Neorhizobium galegae TaxID=399 RepID=UPI0006215008|nr:serine hydrolase [Neorhizobium galegae]MCQ1765580.1 beta-lactamase family protein [Neorhizobium galegae]MCQ1844494.1 beta-lactamase family protein [Neorhizobium galegae]CDZ32948.1 Beta-lactamase class C related penicillin binding protein [Neorhizobium galegae bv. officinalis]